MSPPLHSRLLPKCTFACLDGLLRVMALGLLIALQLLGIGRAEVNDEAGDGGPFGQAAMVLRHLPPVATMQGDNTGEMADSSAVFTAIPVSMDDSNSVSDYDLQFDSGPELYLGYDRGFVTAANQASGQDPGSLDYLMRVNSWMQLRHTLFDSDGPNQDQNTFSFERLRLAFSGHAFSPDLQYFMQFDATSDRSTQSRMHDYFVTYNLARGILGCDENRLGVKVGKWKVPFSRSREESGRRLQFTERATANVFFDLNRAIGVGLYGRCLSRIFPVKWETAFFNGFKTGMTSTNRRNGEMDGNIGWSLRSYTDLLGKYGQDGEPDLNWRECPALRLGGGLACVRVDEEGASEFSRQHVVDSGATLASLLPAGVTAYDVWLYTIDSHLKYRGFSIIGEYYWRYISQFDGGAVPELSDDGFVLQSGYFILPETLELFMRWARIRGNSGTLGLSNQSFDEVGAGFAWFIKGHNAKLIFDATHLNGAPMSSSRLDILSGDIGWLYRTQFQVAF